MQAAQDLRDAIDGFTVVAALLPGIALIAGFIGLVIIATFAIKVAKAFSK